MAHWAEIGDDGMVLRVTVGNNADPDEGRAWLVDNLGGTWVKTSYTSRGGNRVNPDTGEIIAYGNHYRFNYAGIGWAYDPDFGPDGAFIPPQPFPSWTLNPDTALWDAPVPMPSEGGPWQWDEPTLSWVEVTA